MKFFLALSLCFCSLTVSTHLQSATFGSIKVQPVAPSQKCQCGNLGYVELLPSLGRVTSVTNIQCR